MPFQIDLEESDIPYFMLSFQGNTHLYAELNLKKELVRILLENDASDLHSYINASIIFRLANPNNFSALRNILVNYFEVELPHPAFFCLVRIAVTSRQERPTCMITVNGDDGLDEHFQDMVNDVT